MWSTLIPHPPPPPHPQERAKAPNADIAEFLNELAEFEKNVSRVIYKYNVYRKAARAVAALDTRLTSGAEAQKIEGIGKKIGEKIDEFLSTGARPGRRRHAHLFPFPSSGALSAASFPPPLQASWPSWRKSRATMTTTPSKSMPLPGAAHQLTMLPRASPPPAPLLNPPLSPNLFPHP